MPDFSGFKLGRRPNDPSRPRLRLGNYVDPLRLPSVPTSFPALDLSYPMDLNDRIGDCVVAALDHARQEIAARLGLSYANWTSSQIIDYYRTQNPGFPSQDEGMVIQEFLEHLVKQGVILGFAGFDPTVEEEAKAATFLFWAPILGIDLKTVQQRQSVWDYVAGSGEWGGHCVPWVGYLGAPDHLTCVTWGELLSMTVTFVQRQVEEAWIVITEEMVHNPLPGFDLQAFAQDYTELTGRPFPVQVGPEPAPTPSRPWYVRLWHWLTDWLH